MKKKEVSKIKKLEFKIICYITALLMRIFGIEEIYITSVKKDGNK